MRATCPNCGREYDTLLNYDPYDPRPIQDVFPDAAPIQREQCISGICSDECWEMLMGDDDYHGN